MPLPLYNDGLDDLPATAGVNGFEGADLSTKPDAIAPSLIQAGENVWADETGHLATRPGLRFVTFCNDGTLSEGGSAVVQGLAYYDTPEIERLVAVRDGIAYEVQSAGPPAITATLAGISPALSTTAPVRFAQLVNRLFYIDGGARLRWSLFESGAWSHGSVTEFANTNAFPVLGGIVAHRLRLFAWSAAGDRLYASAIGEAHAAANWTQTDNLRFGVGEGDPIVAVRSAQNGNLIVLTQAAAYAVDTRSPNVADWSVVAVSQLAGCAASESAVVIGQEVIYLSRYGVVNLGALATTDSINPAATLSAPVQPIIDRINWAHRSRIFATVWRDLYLLALPIDLDERPTVWLAFNVRTRRWAAPWVAQPGVIISGDIETGDSVMVDEWGGLIVDENGVAFLATSTETAPEDPLQGYGFEGWAAATLSRFDGLQETIFADAVGRLFRVDPSHEGDDANASYTQNVASWASLKSFDFDTPENPKQPFTLELGFEKSTATGLQVVFVPDEDLTFPVVPLADTLRIDEGFNTGTFGVFPITFPLRFRASNSLRKQWHLRHLPRFRAAAVLVHTSRGRMRLRLARFSAFVDTPEIGG